MPSHIWVWGRCLYAAVWQGHKLPIWTYLHSKHCKISSWQIVFAATLLAKPGVQPGCVWICLRGAGTHYHQGRCYPCVENCGSAVYQYVCCTCTHVYIYIYNHTRISIYIYIYNIFTYIHIHIYMYKHTQTYIYIYIYIHNTHTYIYIYICTHTYI